MEGAKTENEIWYIAIDEIQEDNEKKRKKRNSVVVVGGWSNYHAPTVTKYRH